MSSEAPTRRTLSLKVQPEEFPINEIDFLGEWDLSTLRSYRDKLITAVASLHAQIARSDAKGQTDPEWLYKTTFLQNKAEMMLEVVQDRLKFLEHGPYAAAFIEAAGELFEPSDFADIEQRAEEILAKRKHHLQA